MVQETAEDTSLPLGRLMWAMRGKIFVTIVVIAGALLSWFLQRTKQEITTQGMLVIWPGNGLVTAVLKMVMYLFLIVQLRQVSAPFDRQCKRFEQVLLAIGAGVLIFTNLSLLLNLLNKGVPPWHITTIAALAGVAVTVGICFLRLRGKPLGMWVFAVLVGVNFIPTALQGVAFLLYGMKGMPILSCGILLVLAYGMYLQALPKSDSLRETLIAPRRRLRLETDSAILVPLVDLVVQIFTFACCWGAVKLLPSLFPLL